MKVEIKKFASSTNEVQADNLGATYTRIFACVENMHWIHWNAIGPKFDRIHSMADEYYSKLLEDLDFIAELCLQHGMAITHPLMLDVKDFAVYPDFSAIDYQMAIDGMKLILNTFLDALKKLSASLEGHRGDQSKLDDMIAYYDKEVNYKMDRRL